MSEKQKSDCPGYYEVSGYTTDSGKKVDSYTRSCWKHGGGGITNLNEGENPYPDKIFEKANPSEDTPTPTVPTGGGGNPDEIILETLLSLGSVADRAYLSYLSNKKNENPVFSAEKFPNTKGGGQFIQSNYQNFPLSKFDPKKTETDIKNSMKNIEGILKQKEVSNNDILAIRGSLKNSVGSICNDIESISYRRSQQPEIPTIESVEIEKTIEQDRKQTLDNTTNVITSINLAQNALKKNFDSVSMDSPEYNKKLYEYVRQSDELKKMSNSVMDLFQEAKSPKKNSINTVNKIRQDFGFAVSNIPTFAYNGTTGSAVGINNKLAFENISIPYENTIDEEKSTVLKGYIQKSDDYLREINHELHKLENKKINLNINTSHKVMKKYNDFDRFKRLLSLVEALFYVLREDKYTNSNNKIQIFKNELKEELNNYDQLTYPKEKLNINDINTAFILFILDKNEGDIKKLILFLRCLVLWPLTNALLDKFYKRPDINITNKELDIKNDMRHITGLVFYTQKYGAEQARKYGYLKEKLDIFKEGDINDTFIDFENNERGIAFGIKYKNLNKDETIEKIYEEFIKPKRIIKN